MKKLTKREQVMISDDLDIWLNILESRYKIKRGEFIRQAIVEKMKRDIKTLRLIEANSKDYCPF